MADEIYLDNAATTKIDDEVYEVMMDKYKHVYGNASTLYTLGRQAKAVMEESREVIAKSINADTEEIIFTSGGTEGDNTAITQTAIARKDLGKHIITTAIEHEAVIQPLKYLESSGYEVTYLPVDQNGNISISDFKAALRDDTILVTIMMGNNEVGSVMPIREIGEILKDHQAWLHTDAVQAYGLLDIDVKRDHIDMLSISAHKINGPKMTGFLYKKEGVNFPSLLKGGQQEEKRRAGTENVPAIAAMAEAASQISEAEKQIRQAKYFGFKQYLIEAFNKHQIEFEINGEVRPDNLNHIFNIWFKGVSTYVLQTNLDLDRIEVSGGSACTAGSIEPSHVLTAMFGEDSPRISESIRISFGKFTTKEQLDQFIESLVKIIKRLKK